MHMVQVSYTTLRLSLGNILHPIDFLLQKIGPKVECLEIEILEYVVNLSSILVSF
jgi:hypothetical protein